MEAIATFLRLGLMAVLAVAAVAKWRDHEGTMQAASDLGVPDGLAPGVAGLLPATEVVAAAGLVAGVTTRAAGIGAALLFAVFTVLLAKELAAGRAPECNCFGQLSATPISTRTIVRNVALLVAAVTVAAIGGGSLWDEVARMPARSFATGLGVLVVLEAAWIITLLRGARSRPATADPATAVDAGLPVGAAAPPFRLPTTDGQTLGLADALADGRSAVLVFTSPSCAPCADLLPDLARWQRSFADFLSVVPIGTGTRPDNRAKADGVGLAAMVVDEGGTVAHDYRYAGTPGAVVVGPDGTIASELVSGPAEIRRLVIATAGGLAAASGAAIPNDASVLGETAPAFTLDTLHDHPVSLADFGGQLVVVVFWDAACGYCQAALPDLRRWESDHEGTVRLLLVATGLPEALAAQGWRSHVALDPGSVVARSFGGFGTPTAILVDAGGRIASELVVGAEAVLALLDRADTLARLAGSLSPG